MKTRNLLLALAAMFVLVSCETDNDTNPGTTSSAQRIKQINEDYEGITDDRKTVFTYEGEKLAQFIEYYKSESGNWYADYKEDFSYAGSSQEFDSEATIDILTLTVGFRL